MFVSFRSLLSVARPSLRFRASLHTLSAVVRVVPTATILKVSATLPTLSRLLSRKKRQGIFDKMRLALLQALAHYGGRTAYIPHRSATFSLHRLQPRRSLRDAPFTCLFFALQTMFLRGRIRSRQIFVLIVPLKIKNLPIYF